MTTWKPNPNTYFLFLGTLQLVHLFISQFLSLVITTYVQKHFFLKKHFFKDCIYFQREGQGKREKHQHERGTSIGCLSYGPTLGTRLAAFHLWYHTQPTEPRWPGPQAFFFFMCTFICCKIPTTFKVAVILCNLHCRKLVLTRKPGHFAS